MLDHVRNIKQTGMLPHVVVRIGEALVRIGYGHRKASKRNHFRTSGNMEIVEYGFLELNGRNASGRDKRPSLEPGNGGFEKLDAGSWSASAR